MSALSPVRFANMATVFAASSSAKSACRLPLRLWGGIDMRFPERGKMTSVLHRYCFQQPRSHRMDLSLLVKFSSTKQLYTALGLPLRGHWRTRKPKLMGHLHQYGTQCLIVDDAHDLSLDHLMFIKEITDQGRLHYDHPLGLCLVAAGRGNTIPLKATFDLPDPTWLQFRRRLDKLNPFCRIAGHTSEEGREILATLETVYRELFPQLNLRQWTRSIYTWLTQPVLDPTNS